MGSVTRASNGRLRFAYLDNWRSGRDSYPLSVSMPLVVAEHGHASIEPWLWGLLPENEAVLTRWGQQFHVSPRNAFALLGAVGEDCAGAVQFVQMDRMDTILGSGADSVDWLTKADLSERLALLRKEGAAGRMQGDTGQFSLAGAQPKTALFFDGERWGVPSGRTPTTHILKPPLEGLDGHAENEHLCLALASKIGLPAARSKVLRFDGQAVIVVERYDRARIGDRVRRIHQEDLCQALGLPPTKKYQNEGGPSVSAMMGVVRTHSTAPLEDSWTLARALMFNWLICGTDTHAKNFSLLIGAGGSARLAPLYDVASTLVYDFDPRKLKLATKIGGSYLLEEIGVRQWEKFASEARLPKQDVFSVCREMAETLPAKLSEVADRAMADGLDHPIIGRMVESISARAKHCARTTFR